MTAVFIKWRINADKCTASDLALVVTDLHLQSCQCLILFPKAFDSLRLLVFNWQVSISLIIQSSIVLPLFSDSLSRTIINENYKPKQAIHNQISQLGDQKCSIISKEAMHHNYTFALTSLPPVCSF